MPIISATLDEKSMEFEAQMGKTLKNQRLIDVGHLPNSRLEPNRKYSLSPLKDKSLHNIFLFYGSELTTFTEILKIHKN